MAYGLFMKKVWQTGRRFAFTSARSRFAARDYVAGNEESQPLYQKMPPKGFNEVRLLGNVGSDPEDYALGNIQAVLFDLATHRYYKDQEGDTQLHTTWHKILIRNSNLQDYAMQNIKKGCRVFVSGSLNNLYIDSVENPGSKEKMTHVLAYDLILLRRSLERKENYESLSDEAGS